MLFTATLNKGGIDMEYLWREDPGHAWLQVPIDDVKKSGIKVSAFSYQHGNHIFLEEDSDATAFLRVVGGLKEACKFPTKYEDPTPIRNYDRVTL